MEEEPVAILVSGLARSFNEHLYAFLKQLPLNYHLFLSFARSDTKDHFINTAPAIDYLLENPNVKLIIIDSEIPPMTLGLSEREQNVIIYWYRLQKLFANIPGHYTRIFRCRPDIKLQMTIPQFIAQLSAPFEDHTVYIPTGFDIFNEQFKTPNCVNDQIAYGSYAAMRTYCQMYWYLKSTPPIISEQQLYSHLTINGLNIIRTDIPYKLVLSQCFTIAICGDSGAGKSTLSKLIQDVLPFDQTLLFETDRYHKWERGAEQYSTITHLNPNANHLERLSSDTFKLCLGEDVHAVDYDHATGKFTEPKYIKPNKFMLFCGLHTLHKEALNDIYNLKIYLDTDTYLKQQWKIQRDVAVRGADPNVLLQTMKLREPDFLTYIKPQQDAADIIIHLSAKDADTTTILAAATIKRHLSPSIHNKLLPFLRESPIESANDTIQYKFREQVPHEEFAVHLKANNCNLKIPNDNYEGIIKYLVVSLLWK
jgi:uridine kinase